MATRLYAAAFAATLMAAVTTGSTWCTIGAVGFGVALAVSLLPSGPIGCRCPACRERIALRRAQRHARRSGQSTPPPCGHPGCYRTHQPKRP